MCAAASRPPTLGTGLGGARRRRRRGRPVRPAPSRARGSGRGPGGGARALGGWRAAVRASGSPRVRGKRRRAAARKGGADRDPGVPLPRPRHVRRPGWRSGRGRSFHQEQEASGAMSPRSPRFSGFRRGGWLRVPRSRSRCVGRSPAGCARSLPPGTSPRPGMRGAGSSCIILQSPVARPPPLGTDPARGLHFTPGGSRWWD